jgi:hypothetical protein
LRWLRPHTPARDCYLWTLDKGFKQTLSEFLPLFLQKESGFQGKALRISTRKNHVAHSLQKNVFKKWWGWATPDYHYQDCAKAVLHSPDCLDKYGAFGYTQSLFKIITTFDR